MSNRVSWQISLSCEQVCVCDFFFFSPHVVTGCVSLRGRESNECLLFKCRVGVFIEPHLNSWNGDIKILEVDEWMKEKKQKGKEKGNCIMSMDNEKKFSSSWKHTKARGVGKWDDSRHRRRGVHGEETWNKKSIQSQSSKSNVFVWSGDSCVSGKAFSLLICFS